MLGIVGLLALLLPLIGILRGQVALILGILPHWRWRLIATILLAILQGIIAEVALLLSLLSLLSLRGLWGLWWGWCLLLIEAPLLVWCWITPPILQGIIAEVALLPLLILWRAQRIVIHRARGR